MEKFYQTSQYNTLSKDDDLIDFFLFIFSCSFFDFDYFCDQDGKKFAINSNFYTFLGGIEPDFSSLAQSDHNQIIASTYSFYTQMEDLYGMSDKREFNSKDDNEKNKLVARQLLLGADPLEKNSWTNPLLGNII